MIIVPVEKTIDWRRPPMVLIMLVALNVLVFAFYQGDDNEAVYDAVEHYRDKGLLNTEWRAYQAYTKMSDSSSDLRKTDKHAIYIIISDAGFDRFMAQGGERYIPSSKRARWRDARNELERISNKISSKAYGFHTDEISIIELFSYQFLHGDAMHLIGNMVFLVLVGFAVEAALGSAVFLAYYLAAGVGAALLYAASSSSIGGLVGASGSVSGVMAMYVVLFGLRKIKFFYWIFIFTGYVRAAAIIMLPVYILKEVHSYFSIEGSNVAFTAHIGGFICGALLVWLTKEYRSNAIDETYLDNTPEEVDPTSAALQRVYELMGRCEFSKAWEMLKPIKQANANRKDIVELEFNLVRALHPSKLEDYLLHRMGKSGNSENLIGAQLQQWRKYNAVQRAGLSSAKRDSLLSSALDNSVLDIAEQVFETLKADDERAMTLAVSASQIATFCEQKNIPQKAKKYSQLAQNLTKPASVNKLGIEL